MHIETNEGYTGLGKWVSGINLPKQRGNAQVVSTKNRVYLLGGKDEGIISSVISAPIQENGTIGEWVSEIDLPEARTFGHAIIIKGRLYLMGGYNGFNSLSSVISSPIDENGTLGNWRNEKDLPETIDSGQIIIIKNRVYLLGGWREGRGTLSTTLSAPIESDGCIGSWVKENDLPEVRCGSAIAFTGDRLYLLGGYDGFKSLTSTSSASINEDGSMGTWRNEKDLPSPRGFGQSFLVDGRIYLLGGYDDGSLSSVVSAIINKDGTLEPWAIEPDLPEVRTDGSSVATSDRVYIIGGWIGHEYTPSVISAPLLSSNE